MRLISAIIVSASLCSGGAVWAGEDVSTALDTSRVKLRTGRIQRNPALPTPVRIGKSRAVTALVFSVRNGVHYPCAPGQMGPLPLPASYGIQVGKRWAPIAKATSLAGGDVPLDRLDGHIVRGILRRDGDSLVLTRAKPVDTPVRAWLTALLLRFHAGAGASGTKAAGPRAAASDPPGLVPRDVGVVAQYDRTSGLRLTLTRRKYISCAETCPPCAPCSLQEDRPGCRPTTRVTQAKYVVSRTGVLLRETRRSGTF